jgi:hypothetical protein
VVADITPGDCVAREIAFYLPRDETRGLQEDNLAQAARIPVDGGVTAPIPPSLVASHAGHRLYGRLEDPECDRPGWVILDVAYESEENNAIAPATIVLPAVLLDIPVQNPPGATLAEFLGTLRVFANGRFCTEVNLQRDRMRGEDAHLRLGRHEQPEECRTEGALLTFEASLFFGDAESLLVERMMLILGVTQTLRNFGSAPPHSGVEPTPPQAGGGAAVSDVHSSEHPTLDTVTSASGSADGGSAGYWWLAGGIVGACIVITLTLGRGWRQRG